MPSRNVQICCGVFICAATIFCAVSAHAQTKIYNINVGQAPIAAPDTTAAAPAPTPAPVQARMPAPAPVLANNSSYQPIARPSIEPLSPSAFAPGTVPTPVDLMRGQPLAALSQPPLMNAQPPAFTAGQTAPIPQAAAPAPAPLPMPAVQAPIAPPVQTASSVDTLPSVVIEAPPKSVPSDLAEAQPGLKLTPVEDIQAPIMQPPSRPPMPPRPMPQPRPINLAVAPPMGMGTRTGIEFGPQISGYRAHQNGPSTTIAGPRFGGVATATAVYRGFFIAADGRYSAGWLDYNGSGDLTSKLSTLWEARGLVGIDFPFMYFSISPFAGFGYRELTDHLNDISSTGTHLPLVENALYYVPFGVHPRMPIDDRSRFTSTLEYDFVLHGETTTHLNDEGRGDPTIHNEEKKGYGFHVDFMYETPYWSVGPFGSYWNIHTSNPTVYNSPSSTCGAVTCSFTQPASHTIEGGIQFKVHFF